MSDIEIIQRVRTDTSESLPQFSIDALQSPATVALRKVVALRESTELSARFPNHYGANVRVTLADGRVFEHEQRDALGDTELPMSETQFTDKARLLLAQAQVPDVDGLIAATLALASGGTLQAFTAKWP